MIILGNDTTLRKVRRLVGKYSSEVALPIHVIVVDYERTDVILLSEAFRLDVP